MVAGKHHYHRIPLQQECPELRTCQTGHLMLDPVSYAMTIGVISSQSLRRRLKILDQHQAKSKEQFAVPRDVIMSCKAGGVHGHDSTILH